MFYSFLTHLSFCFAEMFLMILISSVLIIESTYAEDEKKKDFLKIFALIGSLLVGIFLLVENNSLPKQLFGMTYQIDEFTQKFKALSMFIFLGYFQFKNIKTEEILTVLHMILGVFVVISSNHYILSYLSLELIGFMAYGLVALEKTKETLSVSIKYFFFGSFASALLLYSIVNIYGVTGSLYYSEIKNIKFFYHYLLYFSIFMKLGLIPFHYWLIEVYSKIKYSTIYIFQTIPKIAFIFFLLKFSSLFSFKNNLLEYFLFVQLIFSSILLIKGNDLRKIISIYSIISSSFVLCILFFKSLPILLTFFILTAIALLVLLEEEDSTIIQYTKFFALLSLIGIPPLAGFQLKWIFIKNLLISENYLLSLGVVLQSGIFFYAILYFLKNLMNQEKKYHLGFYEIKNCFLVLLLLLFNFLIKT